MKLNLSKKWLQWAAETEEGCSVSVNTFTMTDEAEIRTRFEAWVTSSPFERDAARYPDDASEYAWPGAYCDYKVAIAWDAWQEATKQAGARP